MVHYLLVWLVYFQASDQREISDSYLSEHYSLVVGAENCPDIVKHVVEVPVEKGYYILAFPSCSASGMLADFAWVSVTAGESWTVCCSACGPENY